MRTDTVEVLDLNWRDGVLVGSGFRYESSPDTNDPLKVSWNCTFAPSGFEEIAGGVVYVDKQTIDWRACYESKGIVPDDLSDNCYSWRDTAHRGAFMLVVVLPGGCALTGLNDVKPRPRRFKVFKGRLAFYWDLSESDEEVLWKTCQIEEGTLLKICSALNRDVVLPGLEDAKVKLVERWDAVVLKGGGVKGLAYVGALRELGNAGRSFNWFVGTSAGAIAAALMAAGYSADELGEILSGKSFKDFLDAHWFGKVWNFISRGGFYEAQAFTAWLDTLLAEKLNSATQVTFGDLPHRLTVYASRRDRPALVFDSESHFDTSVAYAVRCSMSIPFFFTPQYHEGMRVFDGGMQHNYPIRKLPDEFPEDTFLGLYLGARTYEGETKRRSILGDLISIWTEANDATALRTYRDRTIIIDPRPITTVQFELTDEEKEFLIEAGRLAALRFIGEHDFDAPLGITDEALKEREEALEEKRKELKKKSKQPGPLRSFLIRALILCCLIGVAVGLWYFIKHHKWIKHVDSLPNEIRDGETVVLGVRTTSGGKHIAVSKLVHIRKGASLSIVPGCILEFSADAGIICEGKLIAGGEKGTVGFQAADRVRGWKNIVLMDPDAGTRFTACSFDGGTGYGFDVPNPTKGEEESRFLVHDGQPPLGGAVVVFNANQGVPFVNCNFTNCHATSGGALYVRSSNISLTDCTFEGNSVTSGSGRGGGGAIWAQSSDLKVERCKFTRNAALDEYSAGGAIYLGFRSHCNLQQSRFTQNEATHVGGAIYAINLREKGKEGYTAVRKAVEISHCSFLGNSAGDGGGACFIDQGFKCQLNGNAFVANSIGTNERPLGSKAIPKHLLNGAALMTDGTLDNRAGVTYGAEANSFRHNAAFLSNAQVKTSDELASLYRGPNVAVEPAPENADPSEEKEVLRIEESLLPTTCFTRTSDRRLVDTIVVHYISASHWNDPKFQKLLTQKADLKRKTEQWLAPGYDGVPAAYRWELCKAILEAYNYSAHYLVDRSGKIVRIVNENDVAFHAGFSRMPEPDTRTKVNGFSVGVEFIAGRFDEDASNDTEAVEFTQDQYEAAKHLVELIYHRVATPGAKWSIVGHDEIAGGSVRGVSGAKKDPGSTFDWSFFRGANRTLTLEDASP